MRFVWMPRMVERIKAHEASSSSSNTDQQQQNSDPSLLSVQAEHSSISSYSPLAAHQYVKEAQCSLSPDSSTESYNINLLGGGGGGSCSSYSTAEEGSRTTPWHWQQRNYYYYSDIQQGNDFGTGADLWTDENICFLQQQLADHDV